MLFTMPWISNTPCKPAPTTAGMLTSSVWLSPVGLRWRTTREAPPWRRRQPMRSPASTRRTGRHFLASVFSSVTGPVGVALTCTFGKSYPTTASTPFRSFASSASRFPCSPGSQNPMAGPLLLFSTSVTSTSKYIPWGVAVAGLSVITTAPFRPVNREASLWSSESLALLPMRLLLRGRPLGAGAMGADASGAVAGPAPAPPPAVGVPRLFSLRSRSSSSAAGFGASCGSSSGSPA
mmetsp:Transcript_87116/g.233290  ORF Transcript_87116/g.233290 Transcript_87116/m.233290 type:complete len:236 (+) Transcript_87116:29-736(+)